MLKTSFTANSSSDNFLRNLAYNVLASSSLLEFFFFSWSLIKSLSLRIFHDHCIQGTTSKSDYTNFHDPGIHSDLPILNIQPQCTPATTFSFSFGQSPLKFHKGTIMFTCCHYNDFRKILKGYNVFCKLFTAYIIKQSSRTNIVLCKFKYNLTTFQVPS